MKYLSLLLVVGVMLSCSHVEVLPGLCYTDRTGTFLCPELEEDIKLDPIRDLEDENLCEIWKNVDDPEPYMNCILIARQFEEIA